MGRGQELLLYQTTKKLIRARSTMRARPCQRKVGEKNTRKEGEYRPIKVYSRVKEGRLICRGLLDLEADEGNVRSRRSKIKAQPRRRRGEEDQSAAGSKDADSTGDAITRQNKVAVCHMRECCVKYPAGPGHTARPPALGTMLLYPWVGGDRKGALGCADAITIPCHIK